MASPHYCWSHFENSLEHHVQFLPSVQYDDSVGVLLEIDRSYGGDVYVSDLIPIDADYDSVVNWIHGNVS